MNPEMLMLFLQQLLGTNVPNVNSKGVQQPMDLGWMKDQANYQQDLGQMIGDPLWAGMTGLGGNDPAQFEPVRTPITDMPFNPLEPYLQLDPESDEGAIANAIQAGASPTQAVAARAEAAGWGDETVAQWSEFANNLFTGQAEYNAATQNMDRDEQGNLLGYTEEESDASKMYTELGLPTPVDTWSVDDFGRDVTGGEARRDSMREELTATEQALEEIKRQYGVSESRAGRFDERIAEQNAPEMRDAGMGFTGGVSNEMAARGDYETQMPNQGWGGHRAGLTAGIAADAGANANRPEVEDTPASMFARVLQRGQDMHDPRAQFSQLQERQNSLQGAAKNQRRAYADQNQQSVRDRAYSEARVQGRQDAGMTPLQMALLERIRSATGR